MGSRKRDTSTLSGSDSDSCINDIRYKSRNLGQKRLSGEAVDVGTSKKKYEHLRKKKRNGDKQVRTPQIHEVAILEGSTTPPKTNEPAIESEDAGTVFEQNFTSSVEARVDRLEHLLEIVVQQGQSRECRPVTLRSDCIHEFNP